MWLNLRNCKIALLSIPINLYGFLRITEIMLISSSKPNWTRKFSSNTIIRKYTGMACYRITCLSWMCLDMNTYPIAVVFLLWSSWFLINMEPFLETETWTHSSTNTVSFYFLLRLVYIIRIRGYNWKIHSG